MHWGWKLALGLGCSLIGTAVNTGASLFMNDGIMGAQMAQQNRQMRKQRNWREVPPRQHYKEPQQNDFNTTEYE